MKPYMNGERIEKSYEDICNDLDISPDINFVRVTTAGTITFTCGKPSEVRYLLKMCREKGYKPAKSLIEACK